MVKFMNAVILAAIVAAPALAQSTQEQSAELASREPEPFRGGFGGRGRFGGRRRFRSSSLSERDFDDINELEARELEELDARFWFLARKAVSKVAKKVGGRFLGNLMGRDLEDQDLSELSARELEDLEELAAREPFRGRGRFGGRRRFRSPSPSLSERDFDDMTELDARELEDLDELATREPFRGRGRFGGRRRFRTPSPSLSERDFDESTDLEARRVRSSRLRKALRGSADLASSFVQREVSDIDELSAREYAEFEERCFGAAAKRLAQKDAELNQRNVEEALGELEARDFEGELEVEAREIDELD